MVDRFTEDLEERAARVLSEPVHRYFRQGARGGLSAAEATAAWETYRFLPHVLPTVSWLAFVPVFALNALFLTGLALVIARYAYVVPDIQQLLSFVTVFCSMLLGLSFLLSVLLSIRWSPRLFRLTPSTFLLTSTVRCS